MEKSVRTKVCKFDDQTTADIKIYLNSGERSECLYCHRTFLSSNSKFFAERLSQENSGTTDSVEIECPFSEFDSYVNLLRLLYLSSEESILDSLHSVNTTIGILRASISLQCDLVTRLCIRYLEAVPWDEKEEEEILNLYPALGPEGLLLLTRIQPPDPNASKDVFISAFRFAASLETPVPPFLDELRKSAQEQVEYMLLEDEDTPLITSDDEVRSEIQNGLTKLFNEFHDRLNSLPPGSGELDETTELRVMQSLHDIEWISSVVAKVGMLNHFVMGWIKISDSILALIQHNKYNSSLWAVKIKLLEVTGKALESVGYGSVVLPSLYRIKLLKTWLPYIRKTKLLLDHKFEEEEAFPYRMDIDLCESIEGATVSLVLALPSTDQADILADWMRNPHYANFPDLTEAFELWCYRSKSAKRRLNGSSNGLGGE